MHAPRTPALILAFLLVCLGGCRDSPGRSTVGLARRSDGSLAFVTIWCTGERIENPRIATYNGQPKQFVYQATGRTSEPITVHNVGKPNPGFAQLLNKPLPDGLLVAYNSGDRDEWFAKRSYPSTAAVFSINDLPRSDEPLPTQLLAGNRQTVPLRQLVNEKCVDPSQFARRVPREGG